MAVGIKPRGILRAELRSVSRQITAIIRRDGAVRARTNLLHVVFNDADIASLAAAKAAINNALLRKTAVAVPPPP